MQFNYYIIYIVWVCITWGETVKKSKETHKVQDGSDLVGGQGRGREVTHMGGADGRFQLLIFFSLN